MTITGYTFDKGVVPANRDSILYDKFNFGQSSIIKGRGDDLGISSSGLNVTVGTGFVIVQGRLIEVIDPEVVAIPANSTGYIVITLDLSQQNTTSGTPGQTDYTFTLHQARIEFVRELINDDTNDGKPIFNLQLAAVTSQTSSVTITRNYNVYNNYVLAPDGIVLGNDVNNYGSTFLGNKWYSGGITPADLIIQPASGKKAKVQNESGGNADFQAGNATFDSVISAKKKKATIDFIGGRLTFTETAVGVGAYLDGNISLLVDSTWKIWPTKLPDGITTPEYPAFMNAFAITGIPGVTVKTQIYVKIVFNEDRTISYYSTPFRENEWTAYNISAVPINGSTSWIK